MATVQTLDFTNVDHELSHPAAKFKNGTQKSMTPKAIRARARRGSPMESSELAHLYKPLDEWDDEELARGYPKNKAGRFSTPPAYITREIHEQAMAKFKEMVKTRMREATPDAIARIAALVIDDERDEKGKYVVPPSVQLQAATFLVEHAVGKPVQKQEMDISVKLQAVLAAATAGPADGVGEIGPGLYDYEQIYDVESWEDDDDLQPKGE